GGEPAHRRDARMRASAFAGAQLRIDDSAAAVAQQRVERIDERSAHELAAAVAGDRAAAHRVDDLGDADVLPRMAAIVLTAVVRMAEVAEAGLVEQLVGQAPALEGAA